MIHFVIGTKAQLIKTAPVMCALRERNIPYRYISTGQHRDTMQDILQNFGLPGPDHVLYTGPDIVSVPAMGAWLARILWRTLRERKAIFGNDKRGIVLVHGDTFSTLLGALMGKVAGLTVGHIESGLRSFNIFHPFPEELTRLATFRLADTFFCPGAWASSNVSGYKGTVVNTHANTLIDALRRTPATPLAENLNIPDHPFGIVTLHRFENIHSFQTLERTVRIVEEIANEHRLLFILHKPTKRRLEQTGLLEKLASHQNIELRNRYNYFDFIALLKQAEFVVSDGGSNQEECSYLGKPTLLLRKATERQEGLGTNCVLSNYSADAISQFFSDLPHYRQVTPEPPHSPSALIAEYCQAFA